MRRPAVIVAVLLVVSILLVGVPSLLVSPSTSEIAPEPVPNTQPDLVSPTGEESGFWPYLNSRRAFERRSPINVVVIGETDRVIELLMASTDSNWEETTADLAEADRGTHALVQEDNDTNASTSTSTIEFGSTNIAWTRTTGSTRYTFVDPGDGAAARWIDETAQVHDGTYFGHRYHIRMYESPNPDEQWVAMQTHDEHFDWFTLRHRVHGTQAAQMRLEADLMALPQVDVTEDVRRVYLGNENAKDTDGWATFVELLGMVTGGLIVGFAGGIRTTDRLRTGIRARLTEADRARIAAARDRVEAEHLLLSGTIVGLVLGVRVGGVALEAAGVPSMHAIAAGCYPFVGLGLPIGTYAIARRLEGRLDAALVASGALAIAIWLDYGMLGVSSLPIDVVVHRMLVVIALGLVAAGAARPRTRDAGSARLLLVAAGMWVLLLVGALLGYL